MQRFHLKRRVCLDRHSIGVFVIEDVHLCAAHGLDPACLRAEVPERQFPLARLVGVKFRGLRIIDDGKAHILRLNAPVAPEVSQFFDEPALCRHLFKMPLNACVVKKRIEIAFPFGIAHQKTSLSLILRQMRRGVILQLSPGNPAPAFSGAPPRLSAALLPRR